MIKWLGIIFLLMITLSIWVFFSHKPLKAKINNTPEVDGYLHDVSYTQYDNQGQIHMNIHSPAMIHYLQDNSSHFEKPHILAYSQQRIPWTIDAEHGIALHNSEQVNLWDNVIIHQAPQPHYPETTIQTSAMTIFPHNSYAVTDKPIVITRTDIYIEAIGMQANFKTGIFELLSSVKATYVPLESNNRQ